MAILVSKKSPFREVMGDIADWINTHDWKWAGYILAFIVVIHWIAKHWL